MTQVQFNLLPSSRSEASQSRRGQVKIIGQITKYSFIALAIFILSVLYSEGFQRTQLSSAKNNIVAKTAELQKVSNLNTIATVQNQLQAAAGLHQSKHDTSRLFGYMAKITPPNASINSIQLDLTVNSIKIDGTADSANTVNAFIDSLKYSQYKIAGSKSVSAFSSVVESSFSINQNNVSFSLNANFDPNLFLNSTADSNGKPVTPELSVPSSTTSGSNDPASLFGGGH